MNYIKNVWDWLVRSSADPSKVALTVKGALGTIASIALLISPVMGIDLGQDRVASATEDMVQVAVVLSTIISSIATVVGLVRKIVNTFRGL